MIVIDHDGRATLHEEPSQSRDALLAALNAFQAELNGDTLTAHLILCRREQRERHRKVLDIARRSAEWINFVHGSEVISPDLMVQWFNDELSKGSRA